MAASNDCLNPLSDAPPADRILVIRLGALGDVVRTLPAVARLRRTYPRARIAWLVEPGAASVVEQCGDVDEAIVLARKEIEADWRTGRLHRVAGRLAEFVRGLRRRRFDLVVDWHGILKSGLLARASGAPLRVGFAPPHGRELSSLLVTHRARLVPSPISRFRRNAALIDYLAGRAARAGDGAMVPDAALRGRMVEAIGTDGCAVVLHPGTSAGAAYKRWSVAGYASLAREVMDETGVPCVVSCGADPAEQALAEAIVDAAAPAARRAPPTRDVRELAALFSVCRVFVGSDTGPLHVASAVGTPVVQLMGPTHPVENEPNPDTPWQRVRVPVPCSPCRRGCASADCMQAITPGPVAAAVRAHFGDDRALAGRAG